MSQKNVFKLYPNHVLGFSGNIMNGLCIHPNMEFIIYPVVTDVVIENITSKKQIFLENEIPGELTTIAVSDSGIYVAAGYLPYSGFKAMINLWDFNTHQKLSTYETHKDNVHMLKFSICNNFVISLGGYGEDNSVICYSIKDKEILCGSNASNNTSGDASVLFITNDSNCVFVTGGDNTLRFWKFHSHKKFLEFADISLLKHKRRINCMEANYNNAFLYCGTASGDILKIKMKEHVDREIFIDNVVLFGCFGKKMKNKKKHYPADAERYVLGVTTLQMLDNFHLLIGCGDGTIEIVEETTLDRIIVSGINPNKLASPTLPIFSKKKCVKTGAKITSTTVKKNKIFIGTEASEILFVDMDLKIEKFIVCHQYDINDIVFPHDYSEVFATACGNNIKLWTTEKCTELLLINEPKSICNSLIFTHKGDIIISVWRNGSIKLHTPETGRLIHEVEKAHIFEPKKISISVDDNLIITGDTDGMIKFWKHENSALSFKTQFKKHKGVITSLSLNPSGTMVISSGSEGLCILWDLGECCCKSVISCLTIPYSVKFHPFNEEIITCGADRKIRIWSLDGKPIKEVEASKNSIKCLDLSLDGRFLVTGGCDLKVWLYRESCKLFGIGESPDIVKITLSPDQSTLMTVCDKKRLFIWKLSNQIQMN